MNEPVELFRSPYGLALLHDQAQDYWFVRQGLAGTLNGSAVLPIDGHGQVCLLEIDRVPVGQRMLEIPRGGADPGETAAQAAARELEEETRLIVAADQLIPLGVLHPDSGVIGGYVHLFLAEIGGDFRKRALCHDPAEAAGLKLIPLRDVRTMVVDGRITDGLTVGALARASFAGLI